MIKELVDQIIVYEAEIVPKANVPFHAASRGIPIEKLKNKGLIANKRRYMKAMGQKDEIALHLRSQANKHQRPIWECQPEWHVWISMIYFFEYKKSSNAALLKKDLDNVEKLVQDALTASEVICDDSQITYKMIGKQVTRERPRLEIISIAVSDTFAHFDQWITLQAKHATRRIYEHQIATL
jgi:Holliday junction resolvase RusA-like endonuclease